MAYGIRLATGEVQVVTEGTPLTNEQVDGLLGGGAELVWVDANGSATRLDVPPQFEERAKKERENDENRS